MVACFVDIVEKVSINDTGDIREMLNVHIPWNIWRISIEFMNYSTNLTSFIWKKVLGCKKWWLLRKSYIWLDRTSHTHQISLAYMGQLNRCDNGNYVHECTGYCTGYYQIGVSCDTNWSDFDGELSRGQGRRKHGRKGVTDQIYSLPFCY